MNNWRLIGNNIEYSLSPIIHNYLIAKYKLNANYQIYNTESISKDVLKQFDCGNITIPHKFGAYQISSLDNLEDKSVNCFKLEAGELRYASTDQLGIIDSIKRLSVKYFETRLHVIFGDGATSQMIVGCLVRDFKVPLDKIYVISRKTFDLNISPKHIDYKYFKTKLTGNYILYNSSPLGTAELQAQSPFMESEVKQAIAVFDVAYNPRYNQLAKYAINNHIKYISGLNMLIVQALHAFEFWTGINVLGDYNEIKQHVLLRSSSKLIICAMPFAGKTTLYKRFKRCSCDLDYEVSKFTGMPNNQYIELYGIEQFRDAEAQVLKQALANSQVRVIFLGGGTLTNSDAVNHLSDQLVVYMTVSLPTLLKRFDHSRANISSKEELKKLYYRRNRHYRNLSQIQVGTRNIEGVINEYLDY